MDRDRGFTGQLFPLGATTGAGRDHLDRYYTPADLARVLVDGIGIDSDDRILEPSAGGGAFVRAARAHGAHVTALDIDQQAAGLADADRGLTCDFLGFRPRGERFDLVLGNPPYAPAEAHVRHALAIAPRVAFLLRLAFLESTKRLDLWKVCPLSHVAVLAQRPSFTQGGTDSAAYGFFLWDRDHRGPTTLEIVSWRSS